MNLFEIFHTNQYNDKTLLEHKGKEVSLKELKNFVAAGIAFFNTQQADSAVILSNNSFDFIVWFFACIFANKKIFLLTDASKLQYLNFEYILVDRVPELLPSKTKFDFCKIEPSLTFINFYTSGTSAQPKTVTKRLSNIIEEVNDIYKEFFVAQNTVTPLRVLTSTRAQHMFAFSFYFALPLCFFDKFIIDTTEICYPDDADFKDCIFISTPSFLEKFQKYNVKNEHSPLMIFSAGAKLNQNVFKYLEQNSTVIDIYGSTETGTIAYKINSEDTLLTCLSRVKINVNENSQIAVSSPYFMPELVTTGDIIKIRDLNHFTLSGRSDRVFKIQEKRVSAPEVENAIKNALTDIVKECYCLKAAEKLACAVVLTQKGIDLFFDNKNSITRLTTFLKNKIKDKTEIVPQKWRFLYELPVTKTGKVDRLKIERIFKTNVSLPFVFNVQKDINRAVYNLTFPHGCNFFEGHFNGFPVLPGVVQLYFADFLARDAFGDRVSCECVKKIKFSKIIKPDENLKLVFERKNNLINYMYIRDEQVCSSGVITINEKD